MILVLSLQRRSWGAEGFFPNMLSFFDSLQKLSAERDGAIAERDCALKELGRMKGVEKEREEALMRIASLEELLEVANVTAAAEKMEALEKVRGRPVLFFAVRPPPPNCDDLGV